jgi:poly-gamma-glutamate capsule biosynthesis protein CapA/YwtB (metallophosphatase superfamily)
MKARAAALFAATILAAGDATAATNSLSIYIEDNHAGSFYWLASHLDLDQPCTLIHFDAHSDASGIFDSDKIRTALRAVASRKERQQLLDKWRGQGAIQCFNWIEPLVPAPVSQVIWVPREKLSVEEKLKQTAEATAQLDGHLEAAPRRSGAARERYAVSDLEHLRKSLREDQPLIVTIDLDYFTQMPAAEQAAAFARVWDFVIAQPNLLAITFAISRPYLQSDEEANRLLKLTLDAALSLPTAKIEFEPFLSVANDHSTRARAFKEAGKPLPLYDVTRASEELRARILAEQTRLALEYDRSRWDELLKEWEAEAPRLHLELRSAQPSTDGIWRVSATENAKIELVAEPWISRPRQIEWFALVPKYPCCNVTELRGDQVGFVAGAAPQPVWNEVLIPDTSSSTLPIESIERFFDPKLHCGSLRLRARAVIDGKIRETPVMEMRRFTGAGFRAAITEQFGLPYLFGSGELSDTENTGPEINLGADCANFVVYALRRQGLRIPWSDPRELRQYLELAAPSAAPAGPTFSRAELERGLIVHLGTHVAAVMEDRAPFGVLDENDVVAHQLKGIPEVLTLGELLRTRKKSSFDFYRVPALKPAATLLFGGDVMLGRSCADRIENGIDPFAGIHNLLARAQFVAANLECTISERPRIQPLQKYAFRAPPQSASLLREAGFQAVGLANNHSRDFGSDALRDCAITLTRENVRPIGVGKMREGPHYPDRGDDAYTPEIFPLPSGGKLAVLAISDLPAGRDSTVYPPRREPANSCPIALAANRTRLAAAIEQARSQASLVACLVHWGVENTTAVTDQQRELARWLIDHGVDAVAGSHPHCVQSLDFYHGRPIAYSLGNLVFDGAPTVASWNDGALLKIELSDQAGITSVSLLPIALKDGLPQMATPTTGVLAKQ